MHLIAAVMIVALVQAVVVKLYTVPSESMDATLQVGDRVLVNRLAYVTGAPEVGDVIVFSRPESWAGHADHGALRTVVGWFGDLVGFGPSNQDALVKRVIAGPESTVECCDAAGRIMIDGEALDETYVTNDLPFIPGALDCATAPMSARCFSPVTVPPGSYFVLGDNRANSADSAALCRGTVMTDCARFVPRTTVVGAAFFVLFPVDRAGAVASGGS